ncbi:MAG: hypothetical protein CR967_00325 [Proteobacteria bacterium]|nr:MAG: hypothetical protein CR967_00325 [Pseudomonadota bacterium]
MKDICIVQEYDPSILIKIGESLGNSGVNIEGLSLSTLDNQSVIHFLVSDESSALKALDQTNLKVTSISDVFILSKDQKKVTGKPGSFGGICKLLKENGLNIRFGYPAENNRFVFGVDNIEKAKKLLE